MMYLSKGLPVQKTGVDEFQVSYCGRTYALGPEMAKLWQDARLAPRQVPAGKEQFVQKMEQTGLVAITEEQGRLAHYRLLINCIVCPDPEYAGNAILTGRDRRMMAWIEKAGLRLTTGELVRLEEQKLEPIPELLGDEYRQDLTERIYSRETIFDGIMETMMEHSPARDVVVASLLRLLQAGRLFLV